jgi:hypothetical protein
MQCKGKQAADVSSQHDKNPVEGVTGGGGGKKKAEGQDGFWLGDAGGRPVVIERG